MIGTLGEVVFEVSTSKVKTFDGMKRSGTGRWATHDIIGQKPVMEYLGPGIEQISFTMRLDVFLGVNPSEELAVLRQMRDTGEAVSFVLEGQPVTDNLWVIESLSEDYPAIDNAGRILVANVDINLKEYVKSVVVVT
jgi:phage protein U